MQRLVLVALLAIAGCSAQSGDNKANPTETPTMVAPAPAELAVPRDSALPIPKPRPTKSAGSAPDPTPQPELMCWQDYCPCDQSDPDYGGADVPLCRMVKGGVAVSDQMFAGAAAARDARKQLREFKRENPGF